MLNLLYKLSRNNSEIMAKAERPFVYPNTDSLIELISHSYVNVNIYSLGS